MKSVQKCDQDMKFPVTYSYAFESVRDMICMFNNASSFNQPLNNWNTSHVTTMRGMFQGASLFNQPLNNWNTSNVKNMDVMFWDAVLFNQPLNNWNTSR